MISGCRSNAVLRLVLCEKALEKKGATGKDKENIDIGNETQKDEHSKWARRPCLDVNDMMGTR